MKDNKISIEEAYQAMFYYLENLYELTKSSDLGGFLGSMMLLDDNNPIDPATWEDWINAIEKMKLNKGHISDS